jgi:hypothetical protein
MADDIPLLRRKEALCFNSSRQRNVISEIIVYEDKSGAPRAAGKFNFRYK